MNSEIERLAGEAGGEEETFGDDEFWSFEPEALAKFAALVAEACAKECETQLADGECPERAQYCADAIRAKYPKEPG